MGQEVEEEVIRVTLADAFPDGPPYAQEIFTNERDYIDALKPGAEKLWQDNSMLSVGDPPITSEEAQLILSQPCLSDTRFPNDLYHLLRQERHVEGAWRTIESASILGTDPKTGLPVVPPLYRLADPTLSMVYHIRGIVRSAWYTSEEFQERGVELESNAHDLIPWGIPVHVSIRQPVMIVDVGTSTDAPIAFTSAEGDAFYRIDSISAAHRDELELFRLLRPLAYIVANSLQTETFARPHNVKDLLSVPWKDATLREMWGEIGSSVLAWAKNMDSACINSICYKRLRRLLEPPLVLRLGSARTSSISSVDASRSSISTISSSPITPQAVQEPVIPLKLNNRKRSWCDIEDEDAGTTRILPLTRSTDAYSTPSRPLIDIQQGRLVFKR